MELGEDKIKYLSIYIPQGVFILAAIEPILELRPWLYNVISAIETISLLICFVVMAITTKHIKSFYKSVQYTKFTWLVWLFISLIGILVSYAVDDQDLMIAWGIFAFGDTFCLFLPHKHQKE